MDFKRQTGIFDPTKSKKNITIIGCGSVGSFTALALTKMGANVKEIYDSDKIESHNIPNQFFKLSQVKELKSKALKTLLKEFAGKGDITVGGKVEGDTVMSGDIIISAVDSMESRKIIWERVQVSKPEYYIDSRMGGRVFSMFTVDMTDVKSMQRYEKSLVDDERTAQIPCTERTIIFNVLGLASFVCNQVTKIINNEPFPKEVHFDYTDYRVVKP